MQKPSKNLRKMFEYIMRKTVQPSFRFSPATSIENKLDECCEALAVHYGKMSPERMVDFCVYQIYKGDRLLKTKGIHFKATNYLGATAISKFVERNLNGKFYEDQWLGSFGLCRDKLISLLDDRTNHPLYKFIYPEYEDRTKLRAVSTEAGYYICFSSTLLWTPMSRACKICTFVDRCKYRTAKRFPELYRLRMAEFDDRKEVLDE